MIQNQLDRSIDGRSNCLYAIKKTFDRRDGVVVNVRRALRNIYSLK